MLMVMVTFAKIKHESCWRNPVVSWEAGAVGLMTFRATNGTLHWSHNGHDNVSNHQPHDVFSDAAKKIIKLRVNGLAGNSPATDEFPAQMASKAENVSIWWRHHGKALASLPAPVHEYCTLSYYTHIDAHKHTRKQRCTYTYAYISQLNYPSRYLTHIKYITIIHFVAVVFGFTSTIWKVFN